jgi:hypothetical protein
MPSFPDHMNREWGGRRMKLKNVNPALRL